MDPKHPTIKIPHQQQTQTPPHLRSTKLPFFPTGKPHPHPPPHTAAEGGGYKECLKNHAVGIGGHALDGCGEFMPPTEPSSFKCAACGCHRNFHRREPTTTTSPSPGPPPPEPLNYAFGPQLLLSLSTAADQTHAVATPGTPVAIKIGDRKRFRTKFSHDQKEKMMGFAEKVGWKMQGCDDKIVADFCNEIGIRRRVFKVWMHNNKNNSVKREKDTTTTIAATGLSVDAVVSSNDDSPRQENGSCSSS